PAGPATPSAGSPASRYRKPVGRESGQPVPQTRRTGVRPAGTANPSDGSPASRYRKPVGREYRRRLSLQGDPRADLLDGPAEELPGLGVGDAERPGDLLHRAGPAVGQAEAQEQRLPFVGVETEVCPG